MTNIAFIIIKKLWEVLRGNGKKVKTNYIIISFNSISSLKKLLFVFKAILWLSKNHLYRSLSLSFWKSQQAWKVFWYIKIYYITTTTSTTYILSKKEEILQSLWIWNFFNNIIMMLLMFRKWREKKSWEN